MGRNDLKTRTAITTTIDSKLLEELREHSKRTGINMSKIYDKAVKMYLDSLKAPYHH